MAVNKFPMTLQERVSEVYWDDKSHINNNFWQTWFWTVTAGENKLERFCINCKQFFFIFLSCSGGDKTPRGELSRAIREDRPVSALRNTRERGWWREEYRFMRVYYPCSEFFDWVLLEAPIYVARNSFYGSCCYLLWRRAEHNTQIKAGKYSTKWRTFGTGKHQK